MTDKLKDYHLPCRCHRTTHRDEQGEVIYTDEAACKNHFRPTWEQLKQQLAYDSELLHQHKTAKGTHPMTSNDSTTTVHNRYGVWRSPKIGDGYYDKWDDARAELGAYSMPGNRIWDYSTIPPTDVTDANPEGTHMQTAHPGKRPAPQLPANVNEITIKRSVFSDPPGQVHARITGDTWHITTTTNEADVFTRINEIAATMEAVK